MVRTFCHRLRGACCPVCNNPAHPYCQKQFQGQDWEIDCCTDCGHGFVLQLPSLKRLSQIYENWEDDPVGDATSRDLAEDREAASLATAVARLTRPGQALDVGCGRGSFAYHLSMRNFSPTRMIDLDPRAERAAELVPTGLFQCCAFEDVPIETGPYRAIVMSQVLEHARDPLAWLKHARNLLDHRGVLAIALPNFGGVYRLRGRRDPFLIPPVHLHYFTPDSLSLALHRAGLRVLRMHSCSRVTLEPPRHALSGSQLALRRAWNGATRLLDRTRRGIVLRAYATRG